MHIIVGWRHIHHIAHRFGIYAMGYVGGLLLAGILFAYLLLSDLSLSFRFNLRQCSIGKVGHREPIADSGAINKFRLVLCLLDDPQVELVG